MIDGATSQELEAIREQIIALAKKLSEAERKSIQARGIKKAQESGKPYGRPKMKIPDDFAKTYYRFIQRESRLNEVLYN